MDLSGVVQRWARSDASEQSHSQPFLHDLCDALGVPRPDPKQADGSEQDYVFERHVHVPGVDTTTHARRIDLYRAGCFILEAKQFLVPDHASRSGVKRGTRAWEIKMMEACEQARLYATTLDAPPPFLIVCDIGYCFDLYAAFDGTTAYRPFPTPDKKRISLLDAAAHPDTERLLKRLWTEPHALDPAKNAARVTTKVAEHLAMLARELLAENVDPEALATFLMRCIFTMFAEDVGLLPDNVFKVALEKNWIPHPETFTSQLEALWRAMNTGGDFFLLGRLLRFNGGLFTNPAALRLTKPQLAVLLEAARCDWKEVEPAIFGTLLEQALHASERHMLGAHYTPRAYVERLVRPTIEEPLRKEWEQVRATAHLVGGLGGGEGAQPKANATTPSVGAAKKKPRSKKAEAEAGLAEARDLVRAFHHKLCTTRVLDPACGTGNFLYVTLDLFKRLEAEVLAFLKILGETNRSMFDEPGLSVTPAQFLGIEKKRWAKEIADLVLWIGYLQWFFRARGDDKIAIKEPVLHDYGNIECRDAVLAWDREEVVKDEKGKPVTRWDGTHYKKSPVTGEDVPDDSWQVNVVRYVNPRKAEWPEAEFVVGNPPFLGIAKMRSALGDGYASALRSVYSEMPDSVDLVMYWWNHAADLVASGKVRRAGLITTKSISQAFNRRVVDNWTSNSKLSLLYAIPNHPWVDSLMGADVRISMTVIGDSGVGVLDEVTSERASIDDAPVVDFTRRAGRILPDLRVGPDVLSTISMRANERISSRGVQLMGSGFIVTVEEAQALGLGQDNDLGQHILAYRNGRDIAATCRNQLVIDLFGLTETAVRSRFPSVYQWVLDRVKPERDQNNRKSYRLHWWTFGEPRASFRPAINGLERYIATVETSKHRYFVFLDHKIRADNKLVCIAEEDGWILGVLSSRAHCCWAIASGSRLGVGDDPVYVKSNCFEKFPFPACADFEKARIRQLGEELDSLRKSQQLSSPWLTITGMYNVLEKRRRHDTLAGRDIDIDIAGAVGTLQKIHDDLDAAVFDAYGWPRDLTDEQILERLVALNAERAAEEKSGLVRWLRPEFQNPQGAARLTSGATQVALVGVEEGGETDEGAEALAAAGGAKLRKWPKKMVERITATRDVIQSSGSARGLRAADIAAVFEGADLDEVESAAESLAALGVVMGYAGEEGARYRGV